ncbi:hypothetical protein [Vibrio penaeicida]|uniref:Uncharacterized protein n=2 Tax=Vibrio TaxID=662 RepID=A0A510IIN0_9VIBR|nr:hypothetical protein [Vibrio penaeicida]RTZ24631.1 hypothetical protein EKN09_02935 [Vibrio penaeicida]BBL92306.1 hypothetical protein VroAM7_49590 [Vibrio rotiferianus]GLQ71079.1 hypothetical protein GCM10007932_04390 [Vibrio penaeicida]
MKYIRKNRAFEILQIINEKDSMRLAEQYLFLGQLLGIAEFLQDEDLKSDINEAQIFIEKFLD